MSNSKTKLMLAIIWLGVVVGSMAFVDDGAKSVLDWLLWAIHAGLLGGLAVALRHYYFQIKKSALTDYRFTLMWKAYAKEHKLDNGDGDDQ